MEVWLIGIGMGRVEHLTLEAVAAINRADLILIPRKGEEKAELAQARRRICDEVLTNPQTVLAEFDLPVRDASDGYEGGVLDWHEAIADCWERVIAVHPGALRVAPCAPARLGPELARHAPRELLAVEGSGLDEIAREAGAALTELSPGSFDSTAAVRRLTASMCATPAGL